MLYCLLFVAYFIESCPLVFMCLVSFKPGSKVNKSHRTQLIYVLIDRVANFCWFYISIFRFLYQPFKYPDLSTLKSPWHTVFSEFRAFFPC